MSTIAPPLGGPALLPVILLTDIAIIVIDLSVVQTVAIVKRDMTANVVTPVSMVTKKLSEARGFMRRIRGRLRPRIQLGNLHIGVTESTRRRKTPIVAAIGHIGHIEKGVENGMVGVEDVQDRLKMEPLGPNDSKRASFLALRRAIERKSLMNCRSPCARDAIETKKIAIENARGPDEIVLQKPKKRRVAAVRGIRSGTR